MGLTGPKVGAGCVQVMQVLLDLDCHGSNFVVEHPVAGNLSGVTPISGVGNGLLENLEVPAWTSEHVSEPCQEWFKWGVDAIVRGSIQVNDIGLLIGSLTTVVPRYRTIVVEPNPFGFLVQPSTDWDVEVSDLPIVDLIALRWLIKGLLVMEHPLLQVMEAVFVMLGSHAGTRLLVSDGLEEPIGDAA
jgi:hypothetical protein